MPGPNYNESRDSTKSAFYKRFQNVRHHKGAFGLLVYPEYPWLIKIGWTTWTLTDKTRRTSQTYDRLRGWCCCHCCGGYSWRFVRFFAVCRFVVAASFFLRFSYFRTYAFTLNRSNIAVATFHKKIGHFTLISWAVKQSSFLRKSCFATLLPRRRCWGRSVRYCRAVRDGSHVQPTVSYISPIC